MTWSAARWGSHFMAAACLSSALVAQVPQAPRDVTTLSDGWAFKMGGVVDPTSAQIGSEGWEKVSVPHTWNRAGYYLGDPASHINTAENINKTQGVGWYKLAFSAPALTDGRRAWLQFDAASRLAEVWLNGVRLGEHRGGFSRFRFDATAAMRPGQANVLVVRVDNTQPAKGVNTPATFPLTGDFFIHGGLYRPVSLIVTDAVHIDMLDFGGPGVYAQTKTVRGRNADVQVSSRIRNDGGAAHTVRLVTQLVDASGKSVAKAEQILALKAGETAQPVQQLAVKRARLWQGVADPYLYTLRTEVRAETGEVRDTQDQAFGIRTMRLDPAKGFFLNGKPLKLHGVGLHQDWEGKGWALGPKEVSDTVDIIREMGANTIRLTHYQHGSPIHEIADRTGLILWDEIAVVTAWTLGDDKEVSPELRANAHQQLQDLIRQNYNHASVAVWGLANEVDFGPGRPDFLGRPPANVLDPMEFLRELNTLAKSEDPNRPTVIANCCEDRGMKDVPLTADAADASGVNRYFGWYYGEPHELSNHLDKIRAARPHQPLSVSEYGAGGDITLHTDNPLGGPIDMAGRVQPEEYLSWIHEENWKIIKTKDYLWGSWLWNSFDFATTVRSEGESRDINTKGLVTYDRKVKKDAFYFYKANWSDAPTVHVTGRRYVDRAYPVMQVRVYSNAPTTRLTVNGKAIGQKTNCPDRICVWENVRLAAGQNAVIATGAFKQGAVSDEVTWNLGEANAMAFRIDSGTILAAPSPVPFGSDAWFVGGKAGSTDSPGGRGRKPFTAPIVGSTNRNVAASFREGDFHYRLPLEAGRYKVELTFLEPEKPAGARSFNVSANGAPLLQALDVAQAAGGKLTELRRNFETVVGARGLDLHFQPGTGPAIVSAIEVTPIK